VELGEANRSEVELGEANRNEVELGEANRNEVELGEANSKSEIRRNNVNRAVIEAFPDFFMINHKGQINDIQLCTILCPWCILCVHCGIRLWDIRILTR
jgi:hypothetical protein